MIFGKKHTELTDSELVKKYQKSKNNKYFSEIFNRYGAMVYAVSFKYLKNQEEAQDAVILIFEKALEDLKRMNVTHVKSWLYMVAKNFCLMQLRKRKHHTDDISEIEERLEQPVEEFGFSYRELRLSQMEKAIETLKPAQRQCVVEFYLKEKSYQQIVDETDFSLKEVKSHIQNGKRNIKNWIEADSLRRSDL